MDDGNIAILRGSEVRALLAGRELELIQVVRTAYETHGDGDSSLPHSTFLRFPCQPQDRIIALPAYLGGDFEIARFVLAVFPEVETFVLFDQDEARAKQFENKCQRTFDQVGLEIATDVKAVLRNCPLISIATTALAPHVSELRECPRGSVILHISLRDLTPDAILSCDNVVDDIDHVCRAQTSVHLAEQLVGNRDFIRCTLADILSGRAPARNGSETVSVFSPFGLGVLDLAVGKLVRDLALQQGLETVVGSFLPGPWAEEACEKA